MKSLYTLESYACSLHMSCLCAVLAFPSDGVVTETRFEVEQEALNALKRTRQTHTTGSRSPLGVDMCWGNRTEEEH